jgi:hypothetical protein
MKIATDIVSCWFSVSGTMTSAGSVQSVMIQAAACAAARGAEASGAEDAGEGGLLGAMGGEVLTNAGVWVPDLFDSV